MNTIIYIMWIIQMTFLPHDAEDLQTTWVPVSFGMRGPHEPESSHKTPLTCTHSLIAIDARLS